VHVAVEILEKAFDEFSKKNFEKLKETIHITDDELKDAIAEIVKLNPKPGLTYSDDSENTSQIIPDFIVNNWSGKLDMMLNNKNSSKLQLSPVYEEKSER